MPIIDPDVPKKKNLPLKKMKTVMNICYDKSMISKDIIDDSGFITFTK